MDNYPRLDTQALIDLLAKETEKYTKACVAKVPTTIAHHKVIVDALVKEINTRKAKRRQPTRKY